MTFSTGKSKRKFCDIESLANFFNRKAKKKICDIKNSTNFSTKKQKANFVISKIR
jgi:hypothetical protein